MARSNKVIAKSLSKKGFQAQDGAKHCLYFLVVDGKKTAIKTLLSRGGKDYSDSLLGQMAKQLRVTKKELIGLIDCHISGDDYVERLRASDILPKKAKANGKGQPSDGAEDQPPS